MSRIAGKVVAITGASSGIGEATARVLGERGAKVVLGARRVGHLEELAATLCDRGGQAVVCATDVTRRDDLDRLVGTAVAEFGCLDVLVSNAGISKIGPMSDLDVEGWSTMIDVNIKGVLHGIAAARSAPPRSRRDSSTPNSTVRSTTRPSAKRSAETWMPSVFRRMRWQKPSRRSISPPASKSARSPYRPTVQNWSPAPALRSGAPSQPASPGLPVRWTSAG
jgi:NAD(P)-dependent dehydrogenase (short-subunit alcohol dehydrogenase family)